MENDRVVKSHWPDFFESLSEKIEVEPVLAAIQCDKDGADVSIEESKLLAIDFDKKDNALSISFFGQDVIVSKPKSLSADFDGDDLSGIEVNDEQGCTYVLRFIHPLHLPRAAAAV